jgi:hypothetical protein
MTPLDCRSLRCTTDNLALSGARDRHERVRSVRTSDSAQAGKSVLSI